MRLQEISPEQMARDVGEALQRHAADMAGPQPHGVTVRVDGDPRTGRLARIAADLCRYAQTGAIGDLVDPTCVQIAARSLYVWLRASLVDKLSAWQRAGVAPWWATLAPTSAVDVVICAALARAWAATDQHGIPTAWLAELAGVTPGRVRQLVASGDLRAETQRLPGAGSSLRSLVTPADARRWLAAQGVSGFREDAAETP